MPNGLEVYLSAGFKILLGEDDLALAYRRMSSSDPGFEYTDEDIATQAAMDKLQAAADGRQGILSLEREDSAALGSGSVDWSRIRGGAPAAEASRKTADSNPVTRQANDALKVVKKLQDLLTELAGMDQTSREQIAETAGLQQLPEAIERLYAFSDQLRQGGVQQMQPTYAGWNPEALRRKA